MNGAPRNFPRIKRSYYSCRYGFGQGSCQSDQNIPVVGVGVYLFKSDEVFKSHENFTGISDTPQVLTQIRTAAQCFPVNKLGILYDPTDEDSVLQLKILRAVSEQKNISLFEVAFNPDQRSDIQIRKFWAM